MSDNSTNHNITNPWWAALRPRQWTKNLVVFAALLFTGRFLSPSDVLLTLAVFVIFCALSSAGYLVNDVADAKHDRVHPLKCRRPIAAGLIKTPYAILAASVLAILALGAAGIISIELFETAAGYLALTILYSLLLKHEVILDLLVLTSGFLLRAVAGAAALGVSVSPWLFICVSLLALLLGLGKRRHELFLLGDDAPLHRPILADYSRIFLDHAFTMIAAAVIVTYAIYSVTSPTALNHNSLVFTVLPVLYGILRYTYLIFHREEGGRPEEILLTDRRLQISIILWAAGVMLALALK